VSKTSKVDLAARLIEQTLDYILALLDNFRLAASLAVNRGLLDLTLKRYTV
jgi:hypothetical protein